MLVVQANIHSASPKQPLRYNAAASYRERRALRASAAKIDTIRFFQSAGLRPTFFVNQVLGFIAEFEYYVAYWH